MNSRTRGDTVSSLGQDAPVRSAVPIHTTRAWHHNTKLELASAVAQAVSSVRVPITPASSAMEQVTQLLKETEYRFVRDKLSHSVVLGQKWECVN